MSDEQRVLVGLDIRPRAGPGTVQWLRRVSKASSRTLERLRRRLREAEDTINAIRDGHVEALVVHAPEGEQIYTLRSADQPYRLIVEQMREGALTLAADGTILYCNQRFAELIAQAAGAHHRPERSMTFIDARRLAHAGRACSRPNRRARKCSCGPPPARRTRPSCRRSR